MSYLDSLTCHALAQGFSMDHDPITDNNIQPFISACHLFFFFKEMGEPLTTCCSALCQGLFQQIVPDVHVLGRCSLTIKIGQFDHSLRATRLSSQEEKL